MLFSYFRGVLSGFALVFIFFLLSFRADAAAPGKVSYFRASSYSMTSGQTTKLSWGAPNGYSGAVTYRFWVKKPTDSAMWLKESGITNRSFPRPINMIGTHYFYIQACNAAKECGTKSSVRVVVNEPVPGRVSSFSASDYSLTTGETTTLRWGRPSGFSGAVTYRFWVKKPTDPPKWLKEDKITRLWHDRLINLAGTHYFYIQACNSANKCGAESSVRIIVKDPVPGRVNTFTSSSNQVTEGTNVHLNWAKPSGFSAAVKYNIYIQKQGDALRKQQALTADTSFTWNMTTVGTHKFYVEACNSSSVCGSRSSLSVIVKSPVPGPVSSFTASDYQIKSGTSTRLQWGKPSDFTGAVFYNLYVDKPDGITNYKFQSKLELRQFDRPIDMVGNHIFRVEACDSKGAWSYTNVNGNR